MLGFIKLKEMIHLGIKQKKYIIKLFLLFLFYCQSIPNKLKLFYYVLEFNIFSQLEKFIIPLIYFFLFKKI
jgi:hypothetical protein